MSPEAAFRRVLAARLPAGPAWAAWIDGTVQELAAAMPDEDSRLNEIRALCDEREHGPGPGWIPVDDIRAVLDAVSVDATPEERALAVDFDTEFTIRNAGRPPQGIDRIALTKAIMRWLALGPHGEDGAKILNPLLDEIEALVRPVEGVTLTPEEAALALPYIKRAIETYPWEDDGPLRALAARLEAAQ